MNTRVKEIVPVEAQYYSDYFVKKTREYFRGGARDWQYDIGLIIDHSLKYKKSGKVLELGCGVGTVLFAFSKRGFYCFGVDFDAVQIENARMLSKELKIGDVEFYHLNTHDVSFEDESFDIIVSDNLLEHLPNDELVLYFKQVHKFLKKDGIFVIQTKPTKYTYLTKRKKYVWLLLPMFFLNESQFNRWLRILDKIVPKLYKKITGKKMNNTWQDIPPGHCNCHEYRNLLYKISNNHFRVLFSSTYTYPWSRYYKLLKKILPFKNINTNIFIVAEKL